LLLFIKVYNNNTLIYYENKEENTLSGIPNCTNHSGTPVTGSHGHPNKPLVP
jgi:hypothetical protein